MSYDDRQAAAQLVTCQTCQRSYYMTHPRPQCLRCARYRPMETFTTVLADPPWEYADKLRMAAVKRSSTDQYKTMSVDEISALYTPKRLEYKQGAPGMPGYATARAGQLCGEFDLDDNGFLWLWATNTMLLDGSATRICRDWGFEPKQVITWIKMSKTYAVQLGMGRYTRGATEHLILATRGKAASKVQSHGESNVIFAPRLAHSQKPDVVYHLIESVSPGPYLELFARGRREGWVSWGDQLPPQPPHDTTAHTVVVAPFSMAMTTTSLLPTGPEGEYEVIHPDTEVEWPK